MPIKTRLLITSLLPLLMGVIIGAMNYFENYRSEGINRYREDMQQVGRAVFELTLIDNEYHFGDMRSRVVSQWQQRYQSLGVLLQQPSLFLTDEEADSYSRLRQAYKSVGFLFKEINQIGTNKEGREKLTQEFRDLLIMLSGQQHTKMNEMLEYMDRILVSISKRHQKQMEFLQLLTYGVVGVVVMFSFLLTIFINSHIVQSVRKLRQGTEIIGSGELNHRIDLHCSDELGQLSQAFDQMSRRLRESYTALEERIAELTAANRELESFSYAAAHNFRTPMRTLSGFSALLLEEYGDKLDETGQHYLQEIQEGCREMDRIITAFLKLTRATLVVAARQPVDLSQLAVGILERHRNREPGRPVT